MYPAIDEQVVSFYNALFENIFSEPFRPQITQLIKRRTVERQVQEASDAASQSLTRFLVNQQLTGQQVADLLESFSCLGDRLKLDDIANPNVAPETIVNNLLTDLPCPGTISQTNQDAVYRVALHSIVQVLTMVVDPEALMDLSAARRVFGDREEFGERVEPKDEKDAGIEAALNRVKGHSRNVIVGAPGTGKSTFLRTSPPDQHLPHWRGNWQNDWL
ncbi:MAG: hypothetical protein A3F84_25785 [Candidatus Handelsmanbacteria bacterium RIFCSPLOWO2_12_FULL_64_10]|uniref:Uncharacterized protein n=1 Tax=Handelsmanbacteria sp. (strain RIFCSPLOWO2_12_FULL_64_10) TaxID=1817868 RepID=A0A1F6C3M6_HANXR|nr:MAG: hypothetical protein A3F84_25785 [Candidatus Handelsmanbacteria bacterium RIFCSPLOWO2_12_FULL_64_10]